MLGLTEREYAVRSGLSRTGVQKARRNGRLVFFTDGSIDPAQSDVRLEAMTDPDQRARSRKAVPVEAVGSIRATLQEEGAAPAPDGRITYVEARTAHEVVKGHLARLQLLQKRGELIDRAKTLAAVFALARAERDALVNMPARSAAQMAAELGVGAGRMQQVLEKYVRAHLAERAEVKPNF